MRITGGLAKGIKLTVPPTNVRPATDFTRTQIFNKLGAEILNSVVIDCFAGTGAYGLEALSRGAKLVHFIEQNPIAISAINENIAKVSKSANINPETSSNVIKCNIFKKDLNIHNANIIFFDPPYPLYTENKDIIVKLINNLLNSSPIAKLLIELPKFSKITPPDLNCTQLPNTNKSQITILTKI